MNGPSDTDIFRRYPADGRLLVPRRMLCMIRTALHHLYIQSYHFELGASRNLVNGR